MKENKKVIIKTAIILAILFVIVCVAIILIMNRVKTYELKEVFEIEDIEHSKVPIEKIKNKKIAPIYESLIVNQDNKEIIMLKAKVKLDSTEGNMFYVRNKSYKSTLNVFQVEYEVENSRDVSNVMGKFIDKSKSFLGFSEEIKTQNRLINGKNSKEKHDVGDDIFSNGAICVVTFGMPEENKNNSKTSEKDSKDDTVVPLKVDEKYNVNFYMNNGKLICELIRIF